MKIIIMILFFGLIPIVSFGQNINELLYLKINNYRKKHDLKTLVVEKNAKVANDQQLNYMFETSTVPLDHTQLLKSSYVSTFNSFEDRVHFVCAESFEYIGENLIGIIYENSIEITAEQIFQYWVKSPTHNQLMLSTEPTGFYINYKISNKIIVDGVTFDKYKIIYCVLTTFR